jgi:hypothetical protein
MQYGSQSNALNFAAAHFQGDIFRKVALIHFNDLYSGVVFNLLNKSPMGLLVVLPSSRYNESGVGSLERS